MRTVFLSLWVLASYPLGVAQAAPSRSARLLAEARESEAKFFYRRAQDLARMALEAGDASSDLTWQIHSCLAETAAAMGFSGPAQLAFERVFELHPTFELAPDSSPRLAKPALLARRALAERRLSAEPTSLRVGNAVTTTVKVEGDVANLVESGRLYSSLEEGPHRINLTNAHSLTGTWSCAEPACPHFIALVDVHGNELLTVGSVQAPLLVRTQSPFAPPTTATRVIEPPRPWYRKPWPYAVASAVLAGSGAFFAMRVSQDQSRAQAILSSPGEHYYSDLANIASTRKRDELAMWASFGAGAGAAGVMVIQW